MTVPTRCPTGWDALDNYSDAVLSIYQSLAEVTGARVIVDSGKHSSHGAILRLLPGVEPYLVHLVRDPRAVAYSQSQVKRNPGGDPRRMMGGLSPARSLMYWTGVNVASEAVRRRQGPDRSMLLRYEDFVADPLQAINTITDLVKESGAPTPFIDEHTVNLGLNHMISGNPTRFQRGEVALRKDDRWVTQMSTKDRILASILGLPLSLRYSYPLWRRNGGERSP